MEGSIKGGSAILLSGERGAEDLRGTVGEEGEETRIERQEGIKMLFTSRRILWRCRSPAL